MTSGTLVLNGYLEITVDKDAGDSALMQLEEQVQEARLLRIKLSFCVGACLANCKYQAITHEMLKAFPVHEI